MNVLLSGQVICAFLKCHMTLLPSQTGLLRTSDCLSHFSAPPQGRWLYCGEGRHVVGSVKERPAWECAHVCVRWCYHSATSALSSALSRSPSRITSLRATWAKKKEGKNLKQIIKKQNVGEIWTQEQSGLSSEHCPILTSSYLRSASSAMCFASFSCISWISIFSSSFIARFSITFIPLIGHQRVRISHSRGVSKIPPCNLETQIQPDLSLSSAAFSASSSFCSATASRSWARSSSSSTSWILRFRAATSPSAWDTKKTKTARDELGYSLSKLSKVIFDPVPTRKQEVKAKQQ